MDGGKDPGWAEFFIPLQAVQTSNILIQEPKKVVRSTTALYSADRPLAVLAYHSDIYTMQTLNILTPFLKVANWDSSTGRLDFELESDSATCAKLQTIQETIFQLLGAHPSWLRANKSSKEELKHTFQQMLKDNIFTIYLHGQNQDTRPVGRVWIYKDTGWSKGATPSSFKRGQNLRVALRLQGVCFLQFPGAQTRLRIQHQTIALIHKASPAAPAP
jgi:hypothetical protein